MVLEPEVLDRIHDEGQSLERDVLEDLAREGELFAYRHFDFWQCMDTKRDLTYLKSLWEQGRPPWKVWNDER
jgi:glucose-1-phosphate cytidylyltransferase